jgi:hypothetical protein
MFGGGAGAMLAVSKPPTQTMEDTMDRHQAFALLRRAGSASNTSWTIDGRLGSRFAGEIHDERWIIGFAERFFQAYQEFVIRQAAALLRAALEPGGEEARRN